MEQNNLSITKVDVLTAEILMLKRQTAHNIVEIGKRLIAVKESLPHGEWGVWLTEKVEFSHTSANRFMQVAREFSNSPALVNLPPTKVFALLDLPVEERDEFVQSNPVDSMTTRELQQAIKEKKELEKKLKAAEKEAKDNKRLYDTVSESYNRLEQQNRKHYERAEQLRKDLEDIRQQLTAAQASGDTEKVERLQVTLSHTDNELKNAYSKIEDLERRLKEKPIDVTAATIVEKIPEEVEKELNELRQQVGQQGNQAILKFRVHFESLVNGFKALLGSLDEIKETDAEAHERYRGAVTGLIGKMSEKL